MSRAREAPGLSPSPALSHKAQYLLPTVIIKVSLLTSTKPSKAALPSATDNQHVVLQLQSKTRLEAAQRRPSVPGPSKRELGCPSPCPGTSRTPAGPWRGCAGQQTQPCSASHAPWPLAPQLSCLQQNAAKQSVGRVSHRHQGQESCGAPSSCSGKRSTTAAEERELLEQGGVSFISPWTGILKLRRPFGSPTFLSFHREADRAGGEPRSSRPPRPREGAFPREKGCSGRAGAEPPRDPLHTAPVRRSQGHGHSTAPSALLSGTTVVSWVRAETLL